MNKQDWKNLWLLLKDITAREKKTMVLMVIQSVAGSARPFARTIGMGILVDAMYAGIEQASLLSNALIIVLAMCICSIIESRAQESFEQKQDYTKNIESGVMNRKGLSMDYEYLEDTHVQDLRSRAFAKSYYGIRGWYLFLLRNIVTKTFTVMLTLIILTPTIVETVKKTGSSNFLWALLTVLLIISFINWINFKVKMNYTMKVNDGYNTMDNLFTKKRYYRNMLAGMEAQKDLRILSQQAEINKDIYRICKELQTAERKQSSFYIKRMLVSTLNASISGLLIYLFVAGNAYIGNISIGNIIVFSSSATSMIAAISFLAASIGNMKNMALYAQDYLEYMNLEKKKYPGTIPVEKRRDNRFLVSFENVSFRYPGTDKDVIKNLTIQFEIGEKMAIVGKNGSGKSTFIKLLCRLYDVTEGCIKVNGIDIRMYNYQEYCNLFAVVFQDFCMFAFPLGENIAGSDQFERQEVVEALRKVGLGERLEQLTDGLDTFVGSEFVDNGVAFSGGERQKMAIARAIYKDAPFVIMDEPTAALDPLAECEVYAGFDQMVGKKTALYISHRLASCRFCEDILVFDQGQVVQRGSHEELKEQEGIYRELWNAQAQYYA